MKTIILDFTNCRYIGELHKILKEAFDFPDYYGENLDALWDCLEYYCDYNLHIYIAGYNNLPKDFDSYKEKIYEIFCKVNESSPNITFEVLS